MLAKINAVELTQHAYALDVSGFTILPAQADARELNELRRCADDALAAAAEAIRAGLKLRRTGGSEYYKATRCMYCWGDAMLRFLENESIRALASRTIGDHILWDMGVFSALPAPESESKATISWHRDFGGTLHGTAIPAYLWFFLCLDDATLENGATWIVPGSHHCGAQIKPKSCGVRAGDSLANYPSRMQLCGRAGDILVLNPMTLHASGHNSTSKPRRLLNVGLCHLSLPPLLDHWAIAGAAIQEKASPAVRKLLGEDRKPPDDTFEALPPDHQTSHREENEAVR